MRNAGSVLGAMVLWIASASGIAQARGGGHGGGGHAGFSGGGHATFAGARATGFAGASRFGGGAVHGSPVFSSVAHGRSGAVTIPAPPPAATYRPHWIRRAGVGGRYWVWQYGMPVQALPPDTSSQAVWVTTDQAAVPEDAAQGYMVVDDDWLGGARDWIADAEDEGGCFDRLREIASVGQRFLADQAATLIPLCGDGAEPMLRALPLVVPYIVDGNNTALRIVSLFPLSDDKDAARAALRSAGIDLPE